MSEPLPRRFTMEDMKWARSMLRTNVADLGIPKRFARRLFWIGFDGRMPTMFDIFRSAGSMDVMELARLEEGVGHATCSALYDAMRRSGFIDGSGDSGVDRRICWLYDAVCSEDQGTAYHGKWYAFYHETDGGPGKLV